MSSLLELADKVSGPGVLATLLAGARGAVRWFRRFDDRLEAIETALETHDGQIVDVTDREERHHRENLAALDRITARIDRAIDRRP